MAQGILDTSTKQPPVEQSAWPELPEDHFQRGGMTAVMSMLFPVIAAFAVAITVYDVFF